MGNCCSPSRTSAAPAVASRSNTAVKDTALRQRPTEMGWRGVAELCVVEAKGLLAMDVGGKSDPFVVVSFGPESWRTKTVLKSLAPTWNETIVLPVHEHSSSWVLMVSVYDDDRVSESDLIGRAVVDLAGALGGTPSDVWLDLISEKQAVAGSIHLRLTFKEKTALQREFWKSMAEFFDADGNGVIGKTEMVALMQCIDADLTDAEIDKLFHAADTNRDGDVDADELYALMTNAPGAIFSKFTQCPICNAQFDNPLDAEVICHLAIDFERQAPGEGAREFATGGFLSEQFASKGWYKRLEGKVGNSDEICKSPEFVLVMERGTGHVREEFIPSSIKQALRMIYQTALGSAAAGTQRVRKLLRRLTEQYGTKFTNPKSVAEIPKFIALHKLDVNEILDPLDSFKNFNEFFYRKLKASARPIDGADDPHIITSPADCRCTVFATIDAATSIWIKGDKFTVGSLIGSEKAAEELQGGSLAIFRLAPQDYHRYHCPCDGVVGPTTQLGLEFYTVNPMAVRQPAFNVYTENKRMVTEFTTDHFGKMYFIAIGATMVGSVCHTVSEGQRLKKGDEFGYFAFGGSTVVCVFQRDQMEFDDDLLGNSRRPLETLIRMGAHVGRKATPGSPGSPGSRAASGAAALAAVVASVPAAPSGSAE